MKRMLGVLAVSPGRAISRAARLVLLGAFGLWAANLRAQTAPIAAITTAPSVCSGARYITASVPTQSGCTYAWTITGGTISPGYQNQSAMYYTAAASAGGTVNIQCVVTDADNHTATGNASVSVTAAPAISSFSAASTSILLGQSTTLTAAFTGGSASIDWNVGSVANGVPVTVTPTATTTYTVTVSAPGAPAVTRSVTVAVTAPDAAISTQTPVTSGKTSYLASVPNVAGSTYTWSITGGTITSNFGYYVYYTAGPVGSLALTCTVANASGGSRTGTVTVPVIATPSILSFTAGQANIAPGASTTLMPVFAGGTGVINNGIGPVTSGQGVTVSPGQSATYTLTVTNAAGSTVSVSQAVNVLATPDATISMQTPVTTGGTSYKASVPNVTGNTYAWSITGGTITSNFGYYVYYTAGSIGNLTLTCTATNPAGVTGTGTMTVPVIATPSISSFTAGQANIAPGTSTTLTPIFTGGTGVINNGIGPVTSGQAVTVSPGQTTTYSLTVTNAAGTSVSSSQTINVLAAPDATLSTQTPVTAGGTSYRASVPSVTGNTYAWSITGGTITANGGSWVYFTAGAVGNLTLTCTVTNPAGVPSTGTMTVPVIATPSISSFTAGQANIAPGTSTTLTPIFTGGTGVINNGIGPVTSGQAVTVSPGQTTTYSLTVTNAAGSTVSASQAVNILAAPDATLSTQSPVTAGMTSCMASVPNVTGNTYAWSITGGTITSNYGYYVYFTAGSVGNLTLTCLVTNAAGVSKTGTMTVPVIATPSISSFTAGQANIAPGTSTTLTPIFTGGTGVINNGIGPVASGQAVTISPGQTTTYSLTVANAAGTSASASTTITITQASSAQVSLPAYVTTGASYQASVPSASGNTYAWSITGGTITNNYGYYVYFTPGAAGGTATLTCTVTNGGTSQTGSRTAQIVAAPTIASFTAAPANILPGGTSALAAAFSNGTGVIDQGVGPIVSGTPLSVQPGQTTAYRLTVTNAAGTSVTSSAVTVNVLSPPNALVSMPAYVTTGVAYYQASVPNVTGNTYAWSITGGTITNNYGYYVYFTPGAAGATAMLTCAATNAAGVSQTGSGTAQIVAAPTIASFTANPVNIAPGGTSALTAVFGSGCTGVVDNGVGPIASGTPLSVQPGQTTTYKLTATNAAGTSVSSSTAVVNVPSPPNALVSLPAYATAGVTNYQASVPNAGNTYAWSITGGTITNNNGYWVYFTPGAAGGTVTLTCTVTNAAGVPSTGSGTAQIVAAPIITSFTATPANIAPGGTSALTPVFTNGTGVIDQGVGPVGSGTPVSVQPGQSTTYTLTVTNAAGTSVTSSAAAVNVLSPPNALVSMPAYVTSGVSTCSVSVPYLSGNTYAWSITGGTISSNFGSWVCCMPGAAGGTLTLTCTVTNPAGVSRTGSGTAQIVAAPIITSFTATPANIAPGGTSALTPVFTNGTGVIDQGVGPVGSGTPVSVQPGQSTTYSLTVTNAAGTAVGSSTTVTLVPVALNLLPSSANVPCGFNQLFLAMNTLGQSEPVAWSVVEPGGGTLTPAGVYTPPSVAGVYHVKAISTDPQRAGLSASATVTVPLQVAVTPETAELLPSGTKTFTASLTGTGDTRIAWSVQEGVAGGTVDANGQYTAPASGGNDYHVIATSMAHPATSAVATVRIGTGMVTVAPNMVSLPKGGTQAFTATVDGGTQSVTWSASGGTIDATGNYTAPDRFGTYTVTATRVDDPAIRDEATVVVSGGAGTGAFTYDLNGNLVDDGERTFEWDAENRLVAVTILATGHRSEFGYDEMGRRVEIIEKDPDATQTLQITSDKKYLWDGVEMVEEQAPDGSMLKAFYGQGFVDSDGTVLFYTRDHLGSIRELVDMQQNVRARYEYDSFGRVTKISGDRDSDFLYTGHFWHQQSGLNLTLYRAYDPNLGRWISRDPIEEDGGVNLYGYVLNNPIKYKDKYGLDIFDTLFKATGADYVGMGFGGYAGPGGAIGIIEDRCGNVYFIFSTGLGGGGGQGGKGFGAVMGFLSEPFSGYSEDLENHLSRLSWGGGVVLPVGVGYGGSQASPSGTTSKEGYVGGVGASLTGSYSVLVKHGNKCKRRCKPQETSSIPWDQDPNHNPFGSHSIDWR